MRISEIFSKVCALSVALGYKQIDELPGCLEITVDDCWWFALNAHTETMKTSEGTDVPEFTIYLTFNGWPAGFVNPAGGTLCAGAIANEDALLTAIDAAIAKASQPSSSVPDSLPT